MYTYIYIYIYIYKEGGLRLLGVLIAHYNTPKLLIGPVQWVPSLMGT